MVTGAVTSRRRAQADRELGTTAVGSGAARLLVAGLLATLLAVPAVEEANRLWGAEPAGARPLVSLLTALPEVVSAASSDGFLVGNRRFQEEIDRAETRLEDESLLRAWLLPPVQRLLLAAVGLGNEQVYPGRDGWLFFRADLDHVTGPGFLEPRVLRQRARGGEPWRRPPHPDPLPAILQLRDLLARRGVALVVMPTPVKPTVHPERFSSRSSADPRLGVENPSVAALVAGLEGAGIGYLDLAPILVRARATSTTPLYLRTDTHWNPDAVELVAAELALFLETELGLRGAGSAYFEQPSSVESRGDLFEMLRLPPGQKLIPSERVETRAVRAATGAGWRPQAGAPVLLLGDSFTNVFSDARLGWGSASGLAERLSFHLRLPVDRIALNAGGAHASREALARDLAAGRERLSGTRVVIYQFASRELSFGDWKLLEVPE